MKKIIAMLFIVFTVFSCGSSSSNDEKILRINGNSEGTTLDVNLVTDQTGTMLHDLLSAGLSKYNPETQKYEPALAEKWDVSEDGLVWTFKLREGLKWSDGSDLTVEDFKYSWLRALNPATAAEYAYMLFPIKNAEEYNASKVSEEEVGIKILDANTIEVTLNAPTSYFDSLVSFVTYLPVSKAAVEKFGDQYALEPDTQIYSGAFKITNWEHNSSMTLERNEYYYDNANNKLDKVLVSFISDNGASLNAYKNDELDVVLLTAEQALEYKDSPELNKVDMATSWYVEYNVQNEFLKNVKIRKAILEAINKEEIVETVFNGANRVAYSLTPTGVGIKGLEKDFIEEINGGYVAKYNPEEAKKLYEEGLKELGLEKAPKISIILNDSGSNKKIGEAIQEYLRVNLGLEIDIELMTFKERLQRMKTKTFDLIFAGWGADYQDPMTFLDLFVTGGGNNHPGYSNSEYDALIKLAKTTTNKEERVKALHRVEEIIAEELPIGPLFQTRRQYLVKPKVKGLVFNSFGSEMIFNKVEVE